MAAAGQPRCVNRYPVRVALGHSLGTSAGSDGVRFGRDLLAPAARVAASRRLAAAAPRATRPDGLRQRHRPGSRGGGQRQRPSKMGDEETGPPPDVPRQAGLQAPYPRRCERSPRPEVLVAQSA